MKLILTLLFFLVASNAIQAASSTNELRSCINQTRSLFSKLPPEKSEYFLSQELLLTFSKLTLQIMTIYERNPYLKFEEIYRYFLTQKATVVPKLRSQHIHDGLLLDLDLVNEFNRRLKGKIAANHYGQNRDNMLLFLLKQAKTSWANYKHVDLFSIITAQSQLFDETHQGLEKNLSKRKIFKEKLTRLISDLTQSQNTFYLELLKEIQRLGCPTPILYQSMGSNYDARYPTNLFYHSRSFQYHLYASFYTSQLIPALVKSLDGRSMRELIRDKLK
jgi:hypothetical protein